MGDLKPGRLFRSDLSQQWYFTTRYRDCGRGQFQAVTKHPVENNAELEAGYQARLHLQRLADLVLTDSDGQVSAEQLIDLVARRLASVNA
ncbi:hypothetical protein [Mycobacterium avium]|uniref:hypothetical protein n=1 Tax=Mycobacterium avium TaxID=1764 RepID=UPI000A000B12|nr:hypothetical protein [Mycobacterium avium]